MHAIVAEEVAIKFIYQKLGSCVFESWVNKLCRDLWRRMFCFENYTPANFCITLVGRGWFDTWKDGRVAGLCLDERRAGAAAIGQYMCTGDPSGRG